MGDDRDWQKQLAGAALMAAARTAIEYVTNPESREETVKDVRSRLAEVDYSAAARALSNAIDQLADNAKIALNEAIDSIRENAEEAVEAAAERAQEQLGGKRKKGRGKLFFGMILGVALGFFLLNEDRRNQIMDKLTGASGPIDASQWNTPSSSEPASPPSPPATPTPAPAATPPPSTVATGPAAPGGESAAATQSSSGEEGGSGKSQSKSSKTSETKAAGDGKADESAT